MKKDSSKKKKKIEEDKKFDSLLDSSSSITSSSFSKDSFSDIESKFQYLYNQRKNGITQDETRSLLKHSDIKLKPKERFSQSEFLSKLKSEKKAQLSEKNAKISKAIVKLQDILNYNKAKKLINSLVKLRQLRLYKQRLKKERIINGLYYLQYFFKNFGIKRGFRRITKKPKMGFLRIDTNLSESKEPEFKKIGGTPKGRRTFFKKISQRDIAPKLTLLDISEKNKEEDKDGEENQYMTPKNIVFREMRKKTTQREEPVHQISEEDSKGGEEGEEDDDVRLETDFNVQDTEGDEEAGQATELLEYDKFYKEQFFKEEIFRNEEKFKDKEEDEIKHEIYRMDLKRKIKRKTKYKEALANKGLDVSDLEKEIAALKDEYQKNKKIENEAIDLRMNNTEGLLYKGRLLYNYFNEKSNEGIPKFTIENEKDLKGKEIIDFKPLVEEEKIRRFYDKCCFLKCRKSIYKALVYARYYCSLVVDNFIFDNLSLLIIVINTILILISDPRDSNSLANDSDSIFLYFYTIEAGLKILCFGFLCTERAYLKDYWNILDFFVVMMGWVSFILERQMEGKKISGLAGLRAFRILRPLKTVKAIKGLKKLVIALLASISKLSDTSIVLFFFFLIFAIGGVQMWQGLLLRRCMNVNYGYLVSLVESEGMCTFDTDCEDYQESGDLYMCVKGFQNPDSGVINFDNTLYGFVTVFVIGTLEGWTIIWTYVSKTFKDKIYINPIIIFFYFHVFVFVGSFYLINLFLAVTNSEFTNVERIRKELTSKKSFFLLLKSKYDLKEKEKQEKKRKERELKKKNQKKTDDSLTELKYKIQDEAFHISKNLRDVPVNYTTVKDMYILQNNNPEELYKIDKLIDEEETFLCKDIKRQVRNINQMLKEQKYDKKKTLGSNEDSGRKSTMFSQEGFDEQKIRKRNQASTIIRPIDKIYPSVIEMAITYTQKYIKDEMMNIQKNVGKQRRTETADLLKQKIEKKEMEKFNMLQITLKEDLPYEKSIKEEEEKIEKEKEKDNDKIKKKKKIDKHSSNDKIGGGGSTSRQSNLVSKDVLKEINRKKKNKKINDELSFMTDLSISDGGYSKKNSVVTQNQGLINLNKSTSNNDTTNLNINFENSGDVSGLTNNLIAQNISISSDDSNTPSEIAQKITTINQEEKLEDIVSFPRPSALLPEIIKLKNDEKIKKKLKKMRDHFNVNDFVQKCGNRGLPITTIGRRRSYLNFLKYDQEKENYNDLFKGIPTERSNESNSMEKLDISLYNNNEDNFSLASNSLSDLDILPNKLPERNVVYDENMNIEELNKKMDLNKYTSFARKSFLDRSSRNNAQLLTSEQLKVFYSKINKRMNNNIVIDTKSPRGRNPDAGGVSHIFFDDIGGSENGDSIQKNIKKKKQQQSGDTTGLKEEQIKEEEAQIYFYKSKSVEKHKFKYPIADSMDLVVEEVNKKEKEAYTPQQELIPQNFRSRKFYMNYLYNIKEKDIAVKDTFKVDQWRGDIFGHQKKGIKRKKLPESIEAVFVFNDKKLNLKKYKYLYYKDIQFTDEEFALLTHDLKNLPINILELMPPRMRDYGKYAVGKDINLGALASKSSIRSGTTFSQSRMGTSFTSSTFNARSKSGLNLSSAYGNAHRLQDEIKYKRGFFERVYKKLDEFNYRTLSHYFLEDENLTLKLTDDKRREDKKKEQEEELKAKQGGLEVKSEIRAIKIFDVRSNSSRYNQFSGSDVYYGKDIKKNRIRYNNMIESLEDFGVVLWNRAPGVKQMQKVRYALYLVSISQIFDFIIMALVIGNAIIMALDGNLFTPETFSDISISNYVFNSIFIAEFIIKFFGLGPIVYFSDAFTYLDLVIIAFAILDMATPADNSADIIGANKSLSSQLGFLRVFRIFRVLRLTKILRKMKSMRLIIVSIKRSLANVTYIILILIMFLLIFQLLGMSLLNGNVRYQSFLISFYTTFQILTTENWNGVFFEVSPLSPFVFFYYLIWIFLGNYILFNLFISILLQSFDDADEKDEDDEDEDEIIENMFGLPEYFQQLKEIEKEHKNRLKGKKGGGNIVKTKELHSTSASNSQSHLGTSLNTLSMSKSELSSSSISGMMGDEETDTEDDSRILTGIDKDIKDWQKINQLFRKNECEYSFYFLSQTNPFRIFCMRLVSMKKFDHFILVIILLSTVRLILDTFIAGYVSVLVFDITDLVFNFIFLLEMIFKIIALGLVIDEGTYLRDNWNKIDLVIVIVSLIDIQSLVTKYSSNGDTGGSSSFNFLKVLRLLRTLRPLRFISHNVQLKLIITSLFDSILPICNALFIVIIVFFMFSIVGMNLFYNLYHNCFVPGKDTPFKLADGSFSNNLVDYNVTNNMPEIEKFCTYRYNGILDTGPKFKFSNIFISLLTSYVLGNMEGWPDIMNDYRVFSDYYGIFFVIYLLVVSYFFLNLFTGIMFKYFNDAWSKEKQVAEGDKKAEKYYDFLQQIEFAEPEFATYQMPEEGSWRYYLYIVAKSKIFDNFIMIIIFLNLITMAINYDGTESLYQSVLDKLNLTFTSIFIGECVLKIVALGPYNYFFVGWNRFDFFVVIASIADLIIANIDGITASFLKSFQIIRVLRVLRITRVLRLVKSLKSLEKLLQTLRWSVTALLNVFILMFLIFCIFAILGCYLYENITMEKYGDKFEYLNSYYNLDNFYSSFLLCFRCATGEDWPSIMIELAFIDTAVVSEPQAYLYMIFMNFITAIIMLNLFTMVTLQQYDEFTNKSYNPVEMFENFLNEFNLAWNKYASDQDDGYRMKRILVPNFFTDFNWKKLNFPEVNKLEHIKKYVSDLKLRCDQENFVYYHDVLFKVVVTQMGQKIDRTTSDNMVIFKEEKKIGDAIKKRINTYIMKHEINKTKIKNPLNTFNPLTSHLYFKLSYIYMKTFINHYKENAEAFQNDENASFSASGDYEGTQNNLQESHSSSDDKGEILIANNVSGDKK